MLGSSGDHHDRAVGAVTDTADVPVADDDLSGLQAAAAGHAGFNRRRRRRVGLDYDSDGSTSLGVRATISVAAAAVVILSIVALVRGREPSTETPAGVTPVATVASATTCLGLPCTTLTVTGTLRDPGGEGVWIRACPDDPACDHRALAAESQAVVGLCLTDGLSVYGERTWVRVPWRFIADPIPHGQAARADATGWSDPESPDYGWVSRRYLAPKAAVDSLPRCEPIR
jgi:hypothetical protein